MPYYSLLTKMFNKCLLYEFLKDILAIRQNLVMINLFKSAKYTLVSQNSKINDNLYLFVFVNSSRDLIL